VDREAAVTLGWVVPMGLVVGLALGALGGGGAILAIPALVYLLGQSPPAASMGALVVVAVSAFIGMIPHARAGRVHVVDGIVFGVIGIAGSVAGSHASALLTGPWLLTLFAGLLLVVAALMWRRVTTASLTPGPGEVADGAARGVGRALGAGARGIPEVGRDRDRRRPAHRILRCGRRIRRRAGPRARARVVDARRRRHVAARHRDQLAQRPGLPAEPGHPAGLARRRALRGLRRGRQPWSAPEWPAPSTRVCSPGPSSCCSWGSPGYTAATNVPVLFG
jgi:hypothetical protein